MKQITKNDGQEDLFFAIYCPEIKDGKFVGSHPGPTVLYSFYFISNKKQTLHNKKQVAPI